MNRNRKKYMIFVIITIFLGLFSRQMYSYLPYFINLYLGDALYGLMIYFCICFIFKNFNIFKIGILALGTCYLIEFSQLIQIPELIKIRESMIGRLILGTGFLWSDLLAYLIGILVGIYLESKIKK